MDAVVGSTSQRPTREEAEDAVRSLIRWAGDDPGREGLLDTPARVARSYGEFFAGYGLDPEEVLLKTFVLSQERVVDYIARQISPEVERQIGAATASRNRTNSRNSPRRRFWPC